MVRNPRILSVVLVSMLSCLLPELFAAGVPSLSGEKERQALELAQQMLPGRKLVVRVYDDWQADSSRYRLISVTLAGLTVSFDAVKDAHAAIDESSIVVITGKDQPDEVVAAVIDDFVHVDNYKPAKGLSIWPPWSLVPGYQYLVFTDALGDPIPNAQVEVLLHNQHHYSQKLHLENTVLDGHGRLRCLAVRNTFYRFLFVISHPQYGKASTERFYTDGQDDGQRIVPLVPKGSEAAARAVSGYVVDGEGYGLEGIPVASWVLEMSKSSGLRLLKGAGDMCISVTDEQGWFTLYMPTERDGVLFRDMIPADTKYTLEVVPPKELNMHEYHKPRVAAGSEVLITLESMNPDKHFHTFTFEDGGGIITDPQELKAISIGLYRGEEGRFWRWITYEQWKDGCLLPDGELCAQISRWNHQFHFQPVELTSESPKELVFKSGRKIVYHGEVVDGSTGRPVPNVLVMAKDGYPIGGFSFTSEQLESLRAKALAADSSRRTLYEHDERVTLTDENGRYKFVFLTGLRERLGCFIAFQEGYFSEEAVHPRPTRNPEEIVELPLIKLHKENEHFPAFIFEDPSGNIITDPNILGQIHLKIERGEGDVRRTWLRSYGSLIESNEGIRGTYRATLDWAGQRYKYDPVEVDWGGPENIIFTVNQVSSLGTTYRGRVIDGITGLPIPGAIVMSRSLPANTDASGIGPEHWRAINTPGFRFDSANPVLIPFREVFGFDSITQADEAGQFEMSLKLTGDSGQPALTAVQQGYLGAQQFLRYLSAVQDDSSRSLGNAEAEPDAQGYVKIPPMKLFPAATIVIEPRLPYVAGTRSRVRFYMRTLPGDSTPWLKDFWATPNSNRGASVLLKHDLEQNQYQPVNVLADKELILRIVPAAAGKAPTTIRGVKLKQDELLDLGRLDFPEAFKVTLRVVNPGGEPVKDVRVGCRDVDGFFWAFDGRRPPVTNTDGEAELYVPAHSKGELAVTHHDRESDESFEQTILYKVAGEDEDAGRIFTLQLSEQMYSRLTTANLSGEGRP